MAHFVNEAEDANSAYDAFIEKYKEIIHTCFPFYKMLKAKSWIKSQSHGSLKGY